MKNEYEHRNYSQVFRLKFLTGTTYNAIVGYFQANIPVGVAMYVHKFELLEAPEGINVKPIRRNDMDNVVKFIKSEVEYEPYMTTKPYIDRQFEEKFKNRQYDKVLALEEGWKNHFFVGGEDE